MAVILNEMWLCITVLDSYYRLGIYFFIKLMNKYESVNMTNGFKIFKPMWADSFLKCHRKNMASFFLLFFFWLPGCANSLETGKPLPSLKTIMLITAWWGNGLHLGTESQQMCCGIIISCAFIVFWNRWTKHLD